MTRWLERRDACAAAAHKRLDNAASRVPAMELRARAAKLAGTALVALAALAAIRNARRR
jgi:hypothetical protein